MTTKTKILLTLSLTSFALSSTGAFGGIFLPVGAITFGLFMIFRVLSAETALFEAEQSMRRSIAESNLPARDSEAVHMDAAVSAAPAR